MEVLAKVFGDKFVYVTLKLFFNDSNELSQQSNGINEAFTVYDTEGDNVPSVTAFKAFVTEEVKIPRRRLYREIDRREKQHQSLIVASNSVIGYKNSLANPIFDWAFGRRVLILPFYNTLGMESQSTGNAETVIQDSLFKQQGFDLKKPEIKKQIYCGMIYYCMDVLHMFNLGDLNSTSNDYINNSLVNRRLIGAHNNVYVAALLDKYVPLDELYATEDEIFDAAGPDVDLATFFYENMTINHLKNVTLGAIVDSLEWFGFNIELGGLMENADPKNPWRNDVGKYKLTRVKLKSDFSTEQRRQWLMAPFVCYEPLGSSFSEEDLYGNIPIAHRYKFNKSKFTQKLHEVVATTLKIDEKIRKNIDRKINGKPEEPLLASDFVRPLQKPIKHSQWIQTELCDVLDNKY